MLNSIHLGEQHQQFHELTKLDLLGWYYLISDTCLSTMVMRDGPLRPSSCGIGLGWSQVSSPMRI